MIGQTISHYRILEKLGEGGMGVVYKAEDLTLDRHVGLKFLSRALSFDEAAKKRFIREAKAASALEHPHICSIYEIDQAPDGRLFMVMPCYEGRTLRERLEEGPLEIEEALEIATQVASALAKAHEKGIVHRDIKPGNVMLTDGGRQAKLMDFGLARKQDSTRVTRTGATVGTVMYMSPEQAMGKESDHRTDIWSLGVTLYEMLTGKLPFKGEVEMALLYSIINEDPEPVRAVRRDVPLQVERILEKALAKTAEERYETTGELLKELQEERDKWTLGIKERRFFALRRKTRRRLMRVLVPTGVVALAALAFLVYQKIKPIPPEAIARENSMAVMYFENMADPQDTDKTAEKITYLLTTGLEGSEYLKVISRQRVYDILADVGNVDQKVVDRTTASEVAKRGGVNWAVTGAVVQTDPNLVVAAEVFHCSTGEVRAVVRKGFEPGVDLFAAVDTLRSEIIKRLALPKEAGAEPARAVADVTTSSEDAYQYYVEGMDHFYAFRMDQAVESLRKAVAYDSTFALAYFWMAMSTLPSHAPGFDDAITRALRYSDRAPEMERGFIRSMALGHTEGWPSAVKSLEAVIARFPDAMEPRYWAAILYAHYLGEPEIAMRHFSRVLELDPLYAVAFNDMAGAYSMLGNLEMSLWAINQYIFLKPRDANAYDSKGYTYCQLGDSDKAIETFQKALEVDSTFYFSMETLGHLYLLNGKYDEAEANYRKSLLSADAYNRSVGRCGLALIPMYQGRLDDALDELAGALAEDATDKAKGDHVAEKYFLRSMIYREKRQLDRALSEYGQALEILREDYPDDLLRTELWNREFQVQLLLENGDLSGAQRVADSVGAALTKSGIKRPTYWWSIALIQLSTRDLDDALTSLWKVADSRYNAFFYCGIRYTLAKVYMESNKPDEAAPILEAAVSIGDPDFRARHPLDAVRTYYLLALAYEKTAATDRAIEQYEKFAAIWKDADAVLQPEVKDARDRAARLRGL